MGISFFLCRLSYQQRSSNLLLIHLCMTLGWKRYFSLQLLRQFFYNFAQIQSSVLLLTGHSGMKKMYKACKPLYSGSRSALDYLTEVPCGVCPVSSQCTAVGIISPDNCLYFAQWFGALQEGQEGPNEFLFAW